MVGGCGLAYQSALTIPPPPLCAVFAVFEFKFTYALTLIHTVVTMFGMQGFLAVSEQRARFVCACACVRAVCGS